MILKRTILGTSLAVFMTLAGCGGVGSGDGFSYAMIAPQGASVATGSTLDFVAVPLRGTVTDVHWSVLEAGGGTVSPYISGGEFHATYTAPATRGVYHVHAVISVAESTTAVDAEAKVTVD